MTKEGRDPASTYLRLGVKGGGCSGLGYLVDFCTQQDEHDHLFTSQGVQVVVDKKSMLYVGGLVVDWESSLKGHGWHFKNPNEKTSCGCGQSFTV
jgi:iron-sulfur cluster assembly protein